MQLIAARRDYEVQCYLSVQVLATCQQLYLEGREVLYEENELCIYYGAEPMPYANGPDVDHCHVFDLSLPMPDDLNDTAGNALYLLDYARCKPEYQRSVLGVTKPQTTSRLYSTMTKFQRIRLTLHPSRQAGVWIACNILRELLFGRNVTIVANHMVKEDALGAFRILRCRSIDLRLEIPGLEERVVTEITKTVTSHLPVNTLRAWRLLKKNVLDTVSQNGRSKHRSVGEEAVLLSDLETAARNYDVDRYTGLQSEVLQQADLWNEGYAQQQIATIYEEKVEARK